MILRTLLMVVLSLIVVVSVHAQDESTLPITERCVTDFVEQPDGWTFDGTIITYQGGDGVHGFRADTPTRYYIAFDNYREYGQFGSLSPDGQWLATFTGYVEFNYNCCSIIYEIEHIRVVSTIPRREMYIMDYTFSYYYGGIFLLAPIQWQDNMTFIPSNGSNDVPPSIVNPFEGTFTEISLDEFQNAENFGTLIFDLISNRQPTDLSNMTFNDLPTTFWAINADESQYTIHIFDRENNQIYDTCIDAQHAFTLSPDGNQLALAGQDGGFVYVLNLDEWVAYRLDLAANHVVAWIADVE